MKRKDMLRNPWAGLSSYEDPARSSQKLKFCGRESDTFDVTRLIDDNFFVTLYGKSGIGKTSLLNAGVFPALRREQYTPLSLRLGMTDETQSFQDVITSSVERAVEEAGGNTHVIPVVDEQTDNTAIDYLWNWFARRQFLTTDGQITFPVVVFDQFEEVFRQTESRAKTEVLLAQLHYLIDESHAIGDCIVEGEEYTYDFNFRFVLSIREDDLYRLEDSIDNCALTALKRCRYRLRSLSEQGARAAILVPGDGLFRPEEQEQIAQTIIKIARNKEDQSISTNLLSLVCNRIFVDFQKKSDNDFISQSLVDTFVKGNPFERFYEEATKGFSNKEKNYIEDHLVDSTGRRNSIPESDFLLHVPKGSKLLEGDTRFLQLTSSSSDGNSYRIELIHDSFCDILKTKKQNRTKKKTIIQRLFLNGFYDSVVLSLDIILFLVFFITQSDYSSMLLTLFTMPLLLFSTYMINVTRVHNDRYIEFFLLPQIASSFVFWAYASHHEVYAYYSLKPHTIILLIQFFFVLNLILFCFGLYDYFFVSYKDKKLSLRDFFSFRFKENRYAQFSILFSVVVSTITLFYYGNTGSFYENLRHKTNKNVEDYILLGDYYMTYDIDFEKATDYYQSAVNLGSEIAVNKLDDMKKCDISKITMTEQMKLEVISCFLNSKNLYSMSLGGSQMQLIYIDTILNLHQIDTNIINKSCINNIIEYYDKIGHSDSIVMRWKSIRARIYNEWGNLGYQFWQGEYIAQDKERAFEIYKRHDSHNNVVTCYIYGWGVERDMNKAIKYAEDNNSYLPLSTRIYLKFKQIISNHS